MADRKRQLRAYWSKRENDLVFYHPTQKADGHLLYGVLACERQRHDWHTGKPVYDPSFVEELEKRGFDIKTLRFSVELKPVAHQQSAPGDGEGK
jgi:hypothetical protein